MSTPSASQAATALAPLLQEATDLHASVARLRGVLHLQMRQLDALERSREPNKPEGRVAAGRLTALRRNGQL